MKISKFVTALALALSMGSTSLFAQEADSKLTLSGGADFVSSYVWRGEYQTGASVQPYASLSLGGFSVGVWGSTPFDSSSLKQEVDYYVSYAVGGFSATVTDYWWEGAPNLYMGAGHYYEASLAYSFGESFPLALSVNTMFAGEGDKDGKDQRYSTYITAAYPFTVGDVDFDLGVGVTPSEGYYADEFNVCSVSAKASKAIEITDKFSLPVFVEGIASPSRSSAYIVFGTSLSF